MKQAKFKWYKREQKLEKILNDNINFIVMKTDVQFLWLEEEKRSTDIKVKVTTWEDGL